MKVKEVKRQGWSWAEFYAIARVEPNVAQGGRLERVGPSSQPVETLGCCH